MEAGALIGGAAAKPQAGAPRRGQRVLRLGSLALTLALVACWVVFLRPVALGGRADYVIVSGHSMEPGLETGDVVFARRQPSYSVGDVVVYQVPAGGPGAGDRVIHRVVGGSASAGYVVKGDNKDGIDPWRPKSEDVLGKARLTVPHVGSALLLLRTPAGVALIAALTTFLIALGGSAGAASRRRD